MVNDKDIKLVLTRYTLGLREPMRIKLKKVNVPNDLKADIRHMAVVNNNMYLQIVYDKEGGTALAIRPM